jgi:hypothetical protein
MPEQVRRGLLRHLAAPPPGLGHAARPRAVDEPGADPATPMFTCPYRGRAGRRRRRRVRPRVRSNGADAAGGHLDRHIVKATSCLDVIRARTSALALSGEQVTEARAEPPVPPRPWSRLATSRLPARMRPVCLPAGRTDCVGTPNRACGPNAACGAPCTLCWASRCSTGPQVSPGSGASA